MPSKSSAASTEPADEMSRELELHGHIIAATRALREIAENTNRASYQHRATALLALEDLERRWEQ